MDASPSPRWRTPAAIAAVTALVIAAIWAFSASRHGAPASSGATGTSSPSASASTAPHVLRLQQTRAAGGMAAPMAAADSAGGAKIAGPRGAYVFEGSYPDGPVKGHVLTIAPATEEQVDALAHALGLPAAKKTADGWTATDGKHQLTVTTAGGNQWWYGGYAPPCAISEPGPDAASTGASPGASTGASTHASTDASSAPSTGGDAMCASGSGGSVSSGVAVGSSVAIAAPACVSPTGKEEAIPCPRTDAYTPPPTASDDTVRRAAAAVLAGAGVPLEGARLSVDNGTISVDPLIKGLPSVGLQTSVSVDVDGTVQYANGTLGTLADGDEYPLISAQKAFEQLQNQPRMMPMMMCINPSARPMPPVAQSGDTPKGGSGVAGGAPSTGGPAVDVMPCGNATPEPISVVAVSFGWSLQWLDDNSTVVVPSWLFSMKGSEQWPTPIVAVDPAFLPAPVPDTTKGTVEPGLVDPGAPAVSGGPAPVESGPSAVTGSSPSTWTCPGSDKKFTAPVPCPTQPAAR